MKLLHCFFSVFHGLLFGTLWSFFVVVSSILTYLQPPSEFCLIRLRLYHALFRVCLEAGVGKAQGSACASVGIWTKHGRGSTRGRASLNSSTGPALPSPTPSYWELLQLLEKCR